MENYFRHEYGRLVAVLTRKAGSQNLEYVEDAVQAALATALTAWVIDGPPSEPGAWLYRVAWHHLLGELRKGGG